MVTKLLNIVQPENVYFGQKDAQQCVVIQNMVKDLMINTNVKVLPTTREESGLAMSSRNEYLSPEVRQEAAIIYKSLSKSAQVYQDAVNKGEKKVSSKLILDAFRETFGEPSGFEIEYVAVSHPETLDDLEVVEPGVGAIISTAIRVPKKGSTEKARLIDNVVLH